MPLPENACSPSSLGNKRSNTPIYSPYATVDTQIAINTYDSDTLLLQFDRYFPNNTRIKAVLKDLGMKSQPTGKYSGRQQQKQFPSNVCNGMEPVRRRTLLSVAARFTRCQGGNVKSSLGSRERRHTLSVASWKLVIRRFSVDSRRVA